MRRKQQPTGRRRRTDSTSSRPAPAEPPAGDSRPHGVVPAWCAVAIFVVHVLCLILLVAPTDVIFDRLPIIDQDWGLHFHHLRSLETYWSGDRQLWGYSPDFMAGYPSNTIQDLSIKFFELAAVGLATIALVPMQWFKILTFLAMAGVPWLTWAGARNFFFDHPSRDRIAIGASLLATLYWWNSLPREMFFYGMIGFPTAAFVSLWGLSLGYRLVMEAPRPGLVHAGWLWFAMIIPALHVQSVIIFLPPMLAILIAQAGKLKGGVILWLGAALMICAGANFSWLLTAWQHRHDDASAAIVSQLPLFASGDPFTFVIDYLGSKGYWTFRPSFAEKGLRLALLIMGAVGLRNLLRRDQRALGIALTTAIAGLFTLAYFGAFIPGLAAWQPLRFKVPLDLFLVVSAAYAIVHWFNGGHASRLLPALIAIGLLGFAINVFQTESTGKLRLRTIMRPEIQSIVEWVARETPRDGRVLFEESGDETGFVYDGIYLSAFLPRLTGRQLIGGPINLYNERHHFAEFHSGKLFKREIGAIGDDQLREYLRLYNIGAVVAFHPASVAKLLSIPGLVALDRRIGPVHLMKVNQPLSWFASGEGEIEASANRLELRALKGNEVVLKYHWIDGLSATPPAKIEPFKRADDPIPFIKLVDPPSALRLQAR